MNKREFLQNWAIAGHKSLEEGRLIYEQIESMTKAKSAELQSIKLTGDFVDFERFWSVYPKKVDRKKAKQKWDSIRVDNDLFFKIENHLFKAYANTEKQYIPNPLTYLNNEKWSDEIISAQKTSVESGRPSWMREEEWSRQNKIISDRGV
jgi:hypothetical protein